MEKDGINVTEMLISIKEDVATIKAKMSQVSSTDDKAAKALSLAQENRIQLQELKHWFFRVLFVLGTTIGVTIFVYIVEKYL